VYPLQDSPPERVAAPRLLSFQVSNISKSNPDAFGKNSVEFEYPQLSFSDSGIKYKSTNLIAKVKLHNFPETCAIRIEHPNRRTLDNILIFDFLKDYWESHSADVNESNASSAY